MSLEVASDEATGSAADRVTAAATSAAGTALPSPSPGHSMTSAAPWLPCSIRGLSSATGCTRSNTMRVVPGEGAPVRTAFTTPAGDGARSVDGHEASGRSTTRRSGADSRITRYGTSAPSTISARVPVAPWDNCRFLISPACALVHDSNDTRPRPSSEGKFGLSTRMGRSQAPFIGECNSFFLTNPVPGAPSSQSVQEAAAPAPTDGSSVAAAHHLTPVSVRGCRRARRPLPLTSSSISRSARGR